MLQATFLDSKNRPGYRVVEGKNPESMQPCQFFVSDEYIKRLARYEKTHTQLAAMMNIPHVLQEPTSLFFGLERDGFEDGYCYCGVPQRRYKFGNGGGLIDLPYHKGLVFLVFVNLQPDGLTITSWENRECDPDDSLKPQGWKSDFRTERQIQ